MEYILFCAGGDAAIVVRNLIREGKHINYLVDNRNYNCDYTVDGNTYKVYFPTKLYEENLDNIKIIISSINYYNQVSDQLNEMGFIEGKHYFSCYDYIQQMWGETGVLSPAFEFRVKRMSEMISNSVDSVLDVGCGNMRLKVYLDKHITYLPCDYLKHDDTTIVCDLNKDGFPNVEVDVVFMSGILEYIYDYEEFIKRACYSAKKEIICSYITLECNRDVILRKRNGWVNNLSMKNIVDLFEKYGMKLTYAEKFQKQMLMKFESSGGAILEH